MSERSRNRAIALAAARAYGINPGIFLRQIKQESGFKTIIGSPAGAQGVAQFMPATARGMGVNPNNPRSALYGAARMDAQNLAKYHNWRDVLSLYNSGRGWSSGRQIGETRNYVASILAGARAGAAAAPAAGVAGTPGTPALLATPGSFQGPSRQALARLAATRARTRGGLGMALIAASQASSSGRPMDVTSLLAAVEANRNAQSATAPDRWVPGTPGIPGTPGTPGTAAVPAGGGGKKGGPIEELFYDPLGAIKNGAKIAPIGGHRDHVHFASKSPQQMLAAINAARKLGMHVSENDFVGTVHPVHVTDSNHYKVIGSYRGKKISGAVDAGGTPQQMAALYRWIQRNL
jgi:hypothetical protein